MQNAVNRDPIKSWLALAATKESESKSNMSERIVKSDGLNLNVVQWGQPGAPAIVMLHGLRSASMTWAILAGALADRYHLVAPDQRGRGKSDWDPEGNYFTQFYVSDLLRIVDVLELEQFVLIGHSMGGTNALSFSEQHPERLLGLIIEDMGPGASATSKGALRIRQQLVDTPKSFESRQQVVDYFKGVRPNSSVEAIEARIDTMLKQEASGRFLWQFDLAGITRARLEKVSGGLTDLWPAVKKLSVPTLVLRGAESDFLTPEIYDAMMLSNDRIRGVVIPQASHFVHEDNFDATFTAIDEFLAYLRR